MSSVTSAMSEGPLTSPNSLPPRPIKQLINQLRRNCANGKTQVPSKAILTTSDDSNSFGRSIPPWKGQKKSKSPEPNSYRSYHDNIDLFPVGKNKVQNDKDRKALKGKCSGVERKGGSESDDRRFHDAYQEYGNSGTRRDYGFSSFPIGPCKPSERKSECPRWMWQKSLSDGHLERVLGDDDLDWDWRREKVMLRTLNSRNCDPETLEEKWGRKNLGTVKIGSSEQPRFFRSISLRNLLQLGGMNKSRSGGPLQVKKVVPPTAPIVPGLVSFASFRVKKNQPSRDSSSTTLSVDSSGKDTQRYSGSSLGSTGSSYTTTSSSSSSDNRSSIGTDDGFLLPPPTDYVLKDLEYGGYCQDSSVSNGLKTSASYDSFTSYPTTIATVEMHQNLYGKIGGAVTSNGVASNGINGTGKATGNTSGGGHGHVPGHEGQYTMTQNTNLGQHPQHPTPNVYAHHPLHQQNQTLLNHYQTQISLEDQGIDMTQSPGRESPSSTASSNTGSGTGSAVGSVSSGSGGSNNGCRHSTSSFDSGRASGSTIYQQGVRYSGLSSESSSGSFRHSYHSSNSSLGSIAPEDICNFDVAAMICQGIPDHEVLNAWLTGVHFECYYQNFIQAGYDIRIISRMTPEDLNAIGVTKPHHRKRLKAEISQLNISDGLLDYIPGSIEEWLGLLRLDEYTTKLRGQGYHDVRQVTNITWEDLEDIGILKLGHQKKFMLAIKRVEDILAGKRVPQPMISQHQQQPTSTYLNSHQQQDSFSTRPGSLPSQQQQQTNNSHPPLPYSHLQHHHHQQQQMLINAASGSGYVYARGPPQHQIFRQQPSSIYGQTMSVLTHQPQIHQLEEHREYHPEVISIHVKNSGRRKSMENVANDEPIYGTSSFLPQTQQQQHQTANQTWQRCSAKGTYELQDGETTPTNEMQSFHNAAATTATLPRLLKNKPIAKIMGGGERNSIAPTNCSSSQEYIEQVYSGTSNEGYKSLPRDIGRKSGISNQNHNVGPSYVNYGNYDGIMNGFTNVPQINSKNPPPPPRRGSAPGESIYGPLSTFQHPNASGYSGWTTQFPPPPPALSCDVPYGSSPGKMDDLPLPPHPEELVMNQSQSLQQPSMSSTNGTSTPSSSSSSPNNPVKMVTTSSIVHYHPHSRASPQNTKSRDPSPVGSDFSDSDLPNNGLISRGVRRNGSDASFKSNSSTESESIPFANDNAGTIKQQKASSRATAQLVAHAAAASSSSSSAGTDGTGDVLNDIGNMLADLTDELDAILEQEVKSKR